MDITAQKAQVEQKIAQLQSEIDFQNSLLAILNGNEETIANAIVAANARADESIFNYKATIASAVSQVQEAIQ